MDVGIGLPNALLDVEGPELVAWARRAEQRGFSVLGTIGRIAYGSHEELIALAAAAGADGTDRAHDHCVGGSPASGGPPGEASRHAPSRLGWTVSSRVGYRRARRRLARAGRGAE